MTEQLAFFDQAAGKAPTHPLEPIAREARIEGQYRRWLKRAWGEGPCIGWAMLNPSTADAERDDPTLRRIIGFSYRWGFGSLVVGNVYPFIASTADELWRWRVSFGLDAADSDWSSSDARLRNFHDCAEIFRECGLLMAAWGAGADRDDLELWLETVEADIGREIIWHCLGTTSNGSPIHPLARGRHRVPDDAQPEIWRRST